MLIEIGNFTTEELREFDMMMVETGSPAEPVGAASREVWRAVLTELLRRGKITIEGGSLHELEKIRVKRHWLLFG